MVAHSYSSASLASLFPAVVASRPKFLSFRLPDLFYSSLFILTSKVRSQASYRQHEVVLALEGDLSKAGKVERRGAGEVKAGKAVVDLKDFEKGSDEEEGELLVKLFVRNGDPEVLETGEVEWTCR